MEGIDNLSQMHIQLIKINECLLNWQKFMICSFSKGISCILKYFPRTFLIDTCMILSEATCRCI